MIMLLLGIVLAAILVALDQSSKDSIDDESQMINMQLSQYSFYGKCCLRHTF